MEQILAYIGNYGLPVFIIATCIIAVIGTLKLCKVFNKISNKNVKKFLYYLLDVVFAFAGTAIYFTVFKVPFTDYVVFSITQVTATTTLYAIYENFGLRKLVQIATAAFIKWLTTGKENKFKKLAKKLGLNNAAVILNAVVTEEQNAKDEENKKKE